jgi:hypothetical protein
MPRETFAAFIRTPIATWMSSGGAGAVSADFNANTLATTFGGTAGFTVPFKCTVEKLRFIVGAADFAGASGTLTFVLRKGSATGTALATLTIPLASALRGAVLDANVAAADNEAAKLVDGDKLFITRTATGTVFTGGEGTWTIIARQRPQARA